MNRLLFLVPLLFACCSVFAQTAQPAPSSPSIDGLWSGTLDAGLMKLRIVFHLNSTVTGLSATMDSPDQHASGIPVSQATRVGQALTLEVHVAGGVYQGTINSASDTIAGTWSQSGHEFPLELKAVRDPAAQAQAVGERVRPQNPIRPFPYREEEVSYPNKLQGNTLAGTLTIPPGPGPFTAVLLITGSGPQDRDESLLGHKPFLVLSDFLTRRGIEVLRVDDRGIGKSTGTFASATTADFATDVESGIAFLKTRPEVRKIGLLGHSEGALIAPMVAARNKDVAFIVMLAGPGVPGWQLISEQAKLIAEAEGMPAAQAEAQYKKQRDLYALVLADTSADASTLQKDLHAHMQGDPTADAFIAQVTAPWFRYFLAYDPAPALRQLRIPVLALNGSKDLQVSPQQNLPALRNALKADKLAEVDELPGLNHLFQTAVTGSLTEYSTIDETIAPLALNKIAGWLVAR